MQYVKRRDCGRGKEVLGLLHGALSRAIGAVIQCPSGVGGLRAGVLDRLTECWLLVEEEWLVEVYDLIVG